MGYYLEVVIWEVHNGLPSRNAQSAQVYGYQLVLDADDRFKEYTTILNDAVALKHRRCRIHSIIRFTLLSM